MNAPNIPDTLLYDIVDALHMDLFEVEDGKMRGFDTMATNIGPWKVKTNVTVVSHILRPDMATCFVKVMGSLWLYMVSQAGQPLLACVIDGPVAKLKIEELSSFGADSSLKAAMEKLQPGLITAFEFRDAKWVEVEGNNVKSSHMDTKHQPHPAKNPVPALPAPKVLPGAQATGH